MSEIKGLILAGGLSSRMGFDKSLMIIRNKQQIDYLIDMFRDFNIEVEISCRKEQLDSLSEHGNCITDNYDKIGPMGGILSAFDKDPYLARIVVACDMPNISNRDIRKLIENRDQTSKLTCYTTQDGFPEPLLSIWEPSSYNDLKEAFLINNYSLIRLMNSIDTKRILAESDDIFLNINSPEELNKLN